MEALKSSKLTSRLATFSFLTAAFVWAGWCLYSLTSDALMAGATSGPPMFLPLARGAEVLSGSIMAFAGVGTLLAILGLRAGEAKRGLAITGLAGNGLALLLFAVFTVLAAR